MKDRLYGAVLIILAGITAFLPFVMADTLRPMLAPTAQSMYEDLPVCCSRCSTDSECEEMFPDVESLPTRPR